jgi:Zn finger protein HypA/HybF involved in hydrogenase expression
MKFRIEFTTLPAITIEIDLYLVESFAMHYCTERGLDPSTGKGPMVLSIQRVPDETHCPECNNTELQLSHNTLSAYCPACDKWFDEPAH